MKISNYIYTFILVISIAIFTNSCCKNSEKEISCPLPNQMVSPDKQACICDSNSLLENGTCKYVFPGIKEMISKGYTGILNTNSKSCGDWRDSVCIPFGLNDFTSTDNQLVVGARNKNFYSYTLCQMGYFKKFTNYDSLFALGSMDFPYELDFAIYMKINKNRDTAWASICNVQLYPFLKRLDTCNSVLTRIY